jgi:hypothetical protein
MSGALIEARAQGVEDVPGKLRLMAVAGPGTVSLDAVAGKRPQSGAVDRARP